MMKGFPFVIRNVTLAALRLRTTAILLLFFFLRAKRARKHNLRKVREVDGTVENHFRR